MAKLVAKFGGTSVADIERIERAADKVAKEVERGNQVAVVVSAMSGVTNALIEHCSNVDSLYDAREYDSVVASGEQVTAGLMAMALQKRGIAARSWLGWQVPIICSDVHGKARILEINPDELNKRLEKGEVAVLAGFQGITHSGRIATLGRGGSDTTAVALAAALDADRCDIYTDVDGVYTTDPRIVPGASKLKAVSYEEMLEMASLGAKVLQTRSVEMAFKREVPVQVLSSFGDAIGSDLPGTMVVKEEEIMEDHVVNGITYSRDDAKITILNLDDVPGVAAKVFGPLSKANVNVDMIIQDISTDGKLTDMTFTVPRGDAERAKDVLLKCEDLKGAKIISSTDVAKISVVGIGMRSHAGVAQKMFSALADKGINIQVISTSEIKISVLIAEEYTELAVRTLHNVYGLEHLS
ncbi:MAG: aspartate kinase [Alphaproteobacteria bacterium]|nr:aspartate kinase [Alphaproteobacteria bacterium]